MRTIIGLCLILISTQGVISQKGIAEPIEIEEKRAVIIPKSFMARVTYYSPHEKGYTWGTRISSNPKGKAVMSWTVAVDPKKIPYGSTLYIPALEEAMGDGIFCAEDTGSAVKKLKAIPKSKRGEVDVVIDVYVSNNQTMNKLSNSMPQYMKVYLYE